MADLDDDDDDVEKTQIFLRPSSGGMAPPPKPAEQANEVNLKPQAPAAESSNVDFDITGSHTAPTTPVTDAAPKPAPRPASQPAQSGSNGLLVVLVLVAIALVGYLIVR